jgi:membrane-associated protease RseP (regulator of RpoE activity)
MRRPINNFPGKESASMKTNITTAVAMLLAIAGMMNTSNVQAQQAAAIQTAVPQTQAYVNPGYPPVAPPQQNQFYFGMDLQLNHGYQGTTLRVAQVTPGSPACAAGLEVGDEIRTVNNRSFEYARDSFDAVAMMNRFVSFNRTAPAPAVAASAYGNVQAYVAPRPLPAPRPMARMLVRNVRNGQNVWVNVFPVQRGWSGPAPAAPAAAAAPAYSNQMIPGQVVPGQIVPGQIRQ